MSIEEKINSVAKSINGFTDKIKKDLINFINSPSATNVRAWMSKVAFPILEKVLQTFLEQALRMGVQAALLLLVGHYQDWARA